MSIEAMKQMVKALEDCNRSDMKIVEDAITAGRQAIAEHRLRNNWIGLDAEEIRKTDHHMVVGAYHYSFKQGARWAEEKLKEKNHAK